MWKKCQITGLIFSYRNSRKYKQNVYGNGVANGLGVWRVLIRYTECYTM